MRNFVILAVWVILAGSAVAGPATAPPSPASIAAPTVPSSQQLQAVHELFEVMHYDRQMHQVIGAMMPGLLDAEMRRYRDLTPEQRQAITDSVMDAMTTYEPRMIDAVTVVYAQTFTLDELHGIRDFYTTPVGQALLERMPGTMTRTMDAVRPLVPGLMEEVRQNLCRRVACDHLNAARAS